jgi:hypothetical protein
MECLLLGSGFELAVESYVGVLIETGVAFHARFGLGSAFEDPVIMEEETDTPLNANEGMVVFEGVGLALGFFDEFTVGDASSRPVCGDMVGI